MLNRQRIHFDIAVIFIDLADDTSIAVIKSDDSKY